MDLLVQVLVMVSLPIVVVGLLELAYYPLALSFELRRRKRPVFQSDPPLVSIVVPAFNEERVLANCVDSILAAGYPRKEIFLVDDGSSDGTLAIMGRYEHLPDVTVISQPNAGKAAALNAGIASAAGEILLFVDADGIFTAATVPELLSGFDDPRVGAVCGNDEPVNLDRLQTRLLALLTHNTAFVRRALARVNCLPIVSGNSGAFRRSVIDEIGGFTGGFIGEDLELTWRVHRAGYRVSFRPRAIVYAEVPSTLGALWRQRVRWTRGLVQTALLHRGMMMRSRFGAIGFYLPVNLVAMLLFPLVQLVALGLVILLIATDQSPVSPAALLGLGGLGAFLALVAICFAIGLDRAWGDLRLLYVLPGWLFFSLMMSLVTAWALVLEMRGRPAAWNKLARTGVISRREVID